MEKVKMIRKCLTESEAAEYIGMSKSYLRQDRTYGKYYEGRTAGPEYIKIGRSVRYMIDDLDQWLKRNRVSRAQY